MSDYWKSTGKWFCDICKCWTADNKASISFHEKGKNHQTNLQRRLGEIKKNAIAKRKKEEKDEKMFSEMEKSALAAVQKDLNDPNALIGRSDLKNIVSAHASQTSADHSTDTYPWTTMKAPQGFTYYYNSLTGKSTWEMPEIFKKIEEERKKKEHSTSASDIKKTEKVYGAEDVKEPLEVHDVHPLLGGWSTVKSDSGNTQSTVNNHVEETEIQDSHCSTLNPVGDAVKEETGGAQNQRESGRKFKEKVLKTNLVSSDEPVTFKKRRSASKNVRKRNEDD